MIDNNFTLKALKEGRQVFVESYPTSLDAENSAYSLIEKLEADADDSCDNIILVDRANKQKIFNAVLDKLRGLWSVDVNDIHNNDILSDVDDSMRVAPINKIPKLRPEELTVVAIVPDGDFNPDEDNSLLNYLLGSNMDADNVGDMLGSLRSGNACGSYVLDNCGDDDCAYYDFMDANKDCLDGICCLDDCCSNDPDEFFVSKKFYPVITEEAEEPLDEKILKSRSRNGVNQKLVEVPEDIKATIFGKPYTWAEDDINSALKEIGLSLEDVESWRESGDSPILAADLAKALKKTQNYTEYDLTEILPVVVQIMKKLGLRIPNGGAQLGSRAAKEQGKTALSDFMQKHMTVPGSDAYNDQFEYDDEY